MQDEAIVIERALADAIGYEYDNPNTSAVMRRIIDELKAKHIYIVNWGPGDVQLVQPNSTQAILRDQFASQALDVTLTDFLSHTPTDDQREYFSRVVGKFAYAVADSMMEAREAKRDEPEPQPPVA